MFFVRRAHAKVREGETASTREPLLPKCYDEFKGTKIHNIIEHTNSDIEISNNNTNNPSHQKQTQTQTPRHPRTDHHTTHQHPHLPPNRDARIYTTPVSSIRVFTTHWGIFLYITGAKTFFFFFFF